MDDEALIQQAIAYAYIEAHLTEPLDVARVAAAVTCLPTPSTACSAPLAANH